MTGITKTFNTFQEKHWRNENMCVVKKLAPFTSPMSSLSSTYRKAKKIISNRWVFDIKSDSQKKAHLVAKGFSQIEGINYNKQQTI
jgi:mRNA-degrading endonuclease HigB of HigAB toxin-antitoxin module